MWKNHQISWDGITRKPCEKWNFQVRCTRQFTKEIFNCSDLIAPARWAIKENISFKCGIGKNCQFDTKAFGDWFMRLQLRHSQVNENFIYWQTTNRIVIKSCNRFRRSSGETRNYWLPTIAKQIFSPGTVLSRQDDNALKMTSSWKFITFLFIIIKSLWRLNQNSLSKLRRSSRRWEHVRDSFVDWIEKTKIVTSSGAFLELFTEYNGIIALTSVGAVDVVKDCSEIKWL